MRTVTGNITLLVDEAYADKKIEFLLCDKYGNRINALDLNNQIATKRTVTTNSNGDFTVTLFETEESELPMFYKMRFIEHEEVEDIKLYVTKGNDTTTIFKLLQPAVDLSMFYVVTTDGIVFKDYIADIFNKYFASENTFLNSDEKKLIETFIEYADEKTDSEIIQELDNYLGSL